MKKIWIMVVLAILTVLFAGCTSTQNAPIVKNPPKYQVGDLISNTSNNNYGLIIRSYDLNSDNYTFSLVSRSGQGSWKYVQANEIKQDLRGSIEAALPVVITHLNDISTLEIKPMTTKPTTPVTAIPTTVSPIIAMGAPGPTESLPGSYNFDYKLTNNGDKSNPQIIFMVVGGTGINLVSRVDVSVTMPDGTVQQGYLTPPLSVGKQVAVPGSATLNRIQIWASARDIGRFKIYDQIDPFTSGSNVGSISYQPTPTSSTARPKSEAHFPTDNPTTSPTPITSHGVASDFRAYIG
jgi:hypothetical protein